MQRLSRKDIEAIAKRVIAAYKKLPFLQGQQPDKILPELLAHDLLGLTYRIPYALQKWWNPRSYSLWRSGCPNI